MVPIMLAMRILPDLLVEGVIAGFLFEQDMYFH
jgi:hypothetical protein